MHNYRKYKVIGAILLVIFSVSGCSSRDETLTIANTQYDTKDYGERLESDSDSMDKIFVYICGAVEKEGVYQLDVGSRVYEAIEQAGGFKKKADKNSINLALEVYDGQQIVVPIIGDTNVGTEKKDTLVNINTADAELLMTLTGIGESKSESIISYRENTGRFDCIEDIMKVPGIKEAAFAKIKDKIKVN